MSYAWPAGSRGHNMLDRDIPRLYDGVPDPPPVTAGFNYANSLEYLCQAGTSDCDRTILESTSAWKWYGQYAPYSFRSVPKWKAETDNAILSSFRTPNAVFSTESNGVQGVTLVHGPTHIEDRGPGVSISGTMTDYETQETIEIGGRTAWGFGNSVIVSFDRSHYVFVPSIKARSESNEDRTFTDINEYIDNIEAYPYIIGIGGKTYYREDLAETDDPGVNVGISMALTGQTNRSTPSGSSSNIYSYDYRYEYNYETVYGCGDGNSLNIFSAPTIKGYRADTPQGNIDTYTTGIGTSGTEGTHSVEIMQFKNLDSQAVSGDMRCFYYIDLDTAYKIIDTVGLVWCQDRDQVQEYTGTTTGNTQIHMPIIQADGTTSPEHWSGNEIHDHWKDTPINSNFIKTVGDILDGKIDINKPIDKTNETETEEIPEDTPDLEPETPLLNGLGVFANYFAMTNSNIMELSDFLWNAEETVIDDMINTLKLFGANPINAIMSLRLYPFDVASLLESYQPENIVLGRINTGASGLKIGNGSSTVIDLGTLYIKSQFNDFRDYAPYSSYNLYIPFIGTVNLNPNDYLNKIITLKMIVDVTTGKATAIIYAAGIPMQYLDGMIGVDIPITSSNASETLSSVINAVGYTASAAASIATGNYVAAAGSIAAGAADLMFNDVGINKAGNVSPASSLSAPINAYCIISRPNAIIPPNYGHTIGYICAKKATLSSLTGFTVCENVDTTGIAATEEERNEIKTLLESGVYL